MAIVTVHTVEKLHSKQYVICELKHKLAAECANTWQLGLTTTYSWANKA